MSSGKLEQNYSKYFENDLILSESHIFSGKDIHKSHYFESKPFKEEIKKDFDINLKSSNDGFIDHNFSMVQKIHFILKNSQDLTLKQKYDYCNNQRFYMILYLKEISRKS